MGDCFVTSRSTVDTDGLGERWRCSPTLEGLPRSTVGEVQAGEPSGQVIRLMIGAAIRSSSGRRHGGRRSSRIATLQRVATCGRGWLEPARSAHCGAGPHWVTVSSRCTSSSPTSSTATTVTCLVRRGRAPADRDRALIDLRRAALEGAAGEVVGGMMTRSRSGMLPGVAWNRRRPDPCRSEASMKVGRRSRVVAAVTPTTIVSIRDAGTADVHHDRRRRPGRGSKDI